MERKPRGMALDQQLITTGFWIPDGGVSGTQIDFDFNTMPGNQPKTYADTVFIWQTSQEAIPVGVPPLNTWSVPINTPDGDGSFLVDVTNLSYLLGYGVGSATANICATIFVPALNKGEPTSSQPSLLVTRIGSNSVSFQYTLPSGTQPQTDGDWAGLWQGQGESVLYGVAPDWFVPIGQNMNQGVWAINGVTILRGTEYTLGYFKGGYDQAKPKQSTLACSVTFWS